MMHPPFLWTKATQATSILFAPVHNTAERVTLTECQGTEVSRASCRPAAAGASWLVAQFPAPLQGARVDPGPVLHLPFTRIAQELTVPGARSPA
jgi:hypothetical protein